jgi:hypothetical protein
MKPVDNGEGYKEKTNMVIPYIRKERSMLVRHLYRR